MIQPAARRVAYSFSILALAAFLTVAILVNRIGHAFHTVAETDAILDTIADLVGMTGITLTPLRPSGTVDIGGKRIDVVSEGPMVDRGATVEVTRSRGAVVVVREVA